MSAPDRDEPIQATDDLHAFGGDQPVGVACLIFSALADEMPLAVDLQTSKDVLWFGDSTKVRHMPRIADMDVKLHQRRVQCDRKARAGPRRLIQPPTPAPPAPPWTDNEDKSERGQGSSPWPV